MITLAKKKIFLIFLVALPLCIVLLISLYVFIVIHEVSLKLENINLKATPMIRESSILEEGTIVLKSQLENYLIFSEQMGSFGNWIHDNSENFEIVKNEVLIKKEIKLPKLLTNHCDRYLCFQNQVEFEMIPPSLWKGLIGIEDFRFLEHEGIDYISILRALWADLKAMKLVQGGSTLTQQLVKNLFLTNEKKFERKIRELIYAIYLENKLEKDQIITLYFNEVFWGTIGGIYIKGVTSASLFYFDKKPSELTDFESAILIGMLKGPFYYHPINHLERLIERTKVVYERLDTIGLISTKEGTKWSDVKWQKWKENLEKKNNETISKSIYRVSQNTDTFFQDYEKLVFFESYELTRKLLSSKTENMDIAAKFLAINHDCEGYFCKNSFYFYSKEERDKNKAIFEEKHQVGSVLKPIIYEQFLNHGKSLDDQVSTAPITIKLKSGDWSPKDSSLAHDEFVTLRVAIQKSKNIPLIRTANEIGFDLIEKDLLPYFPSLLKPLSEYPSQLLGSIELSLGELAMVYLKFFKRTCENINEGYYKFENSILYELSKASETTTSKVANEIIKDILMFGKTGTTNSGLDNWYIAFDGKTFYVTWFGVESDRKDKKLSISGATSSFKIFQNFLKYRGKQIYELYCSEKAI